MAPTVRRSQLDSDIFPNYLGVVLSYYCPTFLAGHSNAEIHDFLKWGSVILDTNGHNNFFWPCWTFNICPTTEETPEPLSYGSHWHCVYCDCPNFLNYFSPMPNAA
jgi:hypothetical protein